MWMCLCVCVRICARTQYQTISMGLINSLHHHKGTLLVTVAEFYMHALAPIANFLWLLNQRLQWFLFICSSNANPLFRNACRKLAFFIFLLFSSLLFCALLKTIPSAGTRKNYSETHFKLSERHHQHTRYKRAYSIYILNVDNVVYKRIDFCVRIFFLSKKVLCMHILLSLLSILFIYFVIFFRNYECVFSLLFSNKRLSGKNNSNSILKTLCVHALNCLYKFVWISFKQSNGLFYVLNLIYGGLLFTLLLTRVQSLF